MAVRDRDVVIAWHGSVLRRQDGLSRDDFPKPASNGASAANISNASAFAQDADGLAPEPARRCRRTAAQNSAPGGAPERRCGHRLARQVIARPGAENDVALMTIGCDTRRYSARQSQRPLRSTPTSLYSVVNKAMRTTAWVVLSSRSKSGSHERQIDERLQTCTRNGKRQRPLNGPTSARS